MKELHNLLQQLTTINFKESNAPLIAESIENIIKDNYIENDLYIHSASVLAYYYGKNHRYNASMQWLNNIPANNYNHTWKVFKDTLIPIFRKNKEDEAQVAKMLETNLINLLKIDKLCVSNPLILDNSFHYGYIDVNPKSIIEKYSLLQMKAFLIGMDKTKHIILLLLLMQWYSQRQLKKSKKLLKFVKDLEFQ